MKATITTTREIGTKDVSRVLWWRGDTAMLALTDGTSATVHTAMNDHKATQWMERLIESCDHRGTDSIRTTPNAR